MGKGSITELHSTENIEHLRRIDYYLGIPLLFVVSLWWRIKYAFATPVSKKPRNILFVELSEMGSTILAEPAMRRVKQQHKAELFFCIFKRNAACLKLINLIEDSHVYLIRDDSISHFITDCFRFRAWCLSNNIDTLVDLELFSRFSALLATWSGASNRLGFDACHNEGLYRGNVHNHRLWYNPHCHMSQNFLSLVQQLSCSEPGEPYNKNRIEPEALKITNLDLDPKVLEHTKQKLNTRLADENLSERNLIIMNINEGGAIEQRRWPRLHFVDLIKRVLKYDSNSLVLLSGAVEANVEAEAILKLVAGDRCRNISGLFEIPELPYIYSMAKLMVSCDSGPAHFAAVTDMPVVTLFGPETPALYRPLGQGRTLSAELTCSPCISAANHRRSDCTDNLCMQLITPARVFKEICGLYQISEVIHIAR
jgi:ADP-heptose:LPS heptosyltransferase